MFKKRIIGIVGLLLIIISFSYPLQIFDRVLFANENSQNSDEANIYPLSYHSNVQKDSFVSSIDKPYAFQNIIIPLIVEFIGAFLGVLSALALDSHSSKKQYKEVNNSLYDELKDIEKELEERLQEDNYVYYHYLTPIWDINLSAGNLSLLTNPNTRKNHIDQKYIEIYKKIQYAEELEREYAHSKLLLCQNTNKTIEHKSTVDDFATKYITIIDEARKREATEVYKMIVDLPKDVK